MSLSRDVLDGFWKLGDAKDQVRISSASRIVQHVMVVFSHYISTELAVLNLYFTGLKGIFSPLTRLLFVA